MGEIIGFSIGLIVFFVVLVVLIISFITTPIIYVIITVIVITVIMYFLNLYLEDKFNKKEIGELNIKINEYQKNKEKFNVDSKYKVIIESFTDLRSCLFIGVNVVWVSNGNLCFFPDYPNNETYLLYRNLKPTVIPLRFLEYKRIGKLSHHKFEVNDKTDRLVINSSLNDDSRRTIINYDDNKIVLDYYAYEIINKIVNNS